ncbi:MAG: CPF_0552 family protein [Planctomycetota bacterium]|jgi:hypothetical protein
MEKYIGIVMVRKRLHSAGDVQQIFTEHGCNIKTRLGIHDGVTDKCSEEGLIVLELVGEKKTLEGMIEKINSISGVRAKLVDLAF